MYKKRLVGKIGIVISLYLILSLGVAGLAQAEEEIPLGILTSLTGPLGTEGQPIYKTWQWQVEEINTLGGPLGRPIKLYVADTETSVEKGMMGARKLITMNRVKGILGPSSDIMVAIMGYCKDNKVPLISQWSGTHKLSMTGGEYQFRTAPDDFFEGFAAAAFMLDKGWKKIGLIVLNRESPKSIGKIVETQVEKMGGKIVAKQVIEPGMTTYRSEIRKIDQANPEAVFLAVDLDTLAILYPQMYEMGIEYKVILGSDAHQPTTIEVIGADALEGVYAEKPAAAAGTLAYDIFEAKYKHHMEIGVSAFTPNAYDALNIWALAVQAAGKVDGEAIAHKIRYVANPPGTKVNTFAEGMVLLLRGQDINYDGASGPCDFNEYGDIMGNARVVQVQKGKWVDVRFYSGDEIAKIVGE